MFETRWNLPNCIGALDGKHVQIVPPYNSGSIYFNYKHTFSIVLMALVDAEYRFRYVDIGSNGRVSDGGVFSGCSLFQALETKQAGIPEPRPLPGGEVPTNFFIVADEAFALKEYLIKPYPHRNLTRPQRIYNYRLSRARRVVENAFGILANRFRVFRSAIHLEPHNVEHIVLAACVLHNFLREKLGNSYVDSVDKEIGENKELVQGSWRSGTQFEELGSNPPRNSTARAKELRDHVCSYVNSDVGSVPWQASKI